MVHFVRNHQTCIATLITLYILPNQRWYDIKYMYIIGFPFGKQMYTCQNLH